MRNRYLILGAFVVAFVTQTARSGFDLSLAIGLIALYLAVYEIRSNSDPWVRVRQCEASSRESVRENDGQSFSQFQIVIENRGVKLVNPTVSLSFRGPDRRGWFSLHLKEFKEAHGDCQEFERGMIAVFGWKSYELEKADKQFLSLLHDPYKQNATIRIFSQSYVAYEFPVGNWSDRLKAKWNRLAFGVNWKLRRNVRTTDGETMLHTPTVLPTCITFQQRLMDFIEWSSKPAKS